jgi:hypothetical protein
MSEKFKFSDAVLGRIINVLQESFLTGTDVLDLFRQMEMKPCDDDPHSLTLTEEYSKVVDEWHKQIEEDIKKVEETMKTATLKDIAFSENTEPSFILGTCDDPPEGDIGGILDLSGFNLKKVN